MNLQSPSSLLHGMIAVGGSAVPLMMKLKQQLKLLATAGHLHNISTNTTADDLDDVTLGAQIGRACYELYHQAPTGLAPDSVRYETKPAPQSPTDINKQNTASKSDAQVEATNTTTGREQQQESSNSTSPVADTPPQPQQQTAKPAPPPSMVTSWVPQSKADFLRPETVETLFYLWRATGDEIYREWGWNMFRAFEKFCRVDSGGYSTMDDVMQVSGTDVTHVLYFNSYILQRHHTAGVASRSVIPVPAVGASALSSTHW